MSNPRTREPRIPKHRKPPAQTTEAPTEAIDEEETSAFIERDRRHGLIAQHAYSLAEQRGFEPGQELDDWLTAERNVEQAFDSEDEEDSGSPQCGD